MDCGLLHVGVVALAAGLALAAPAVAQAPAGASECLSCHGAEGKAQIPFVPIIHGQQLPFLRAALADYRDGRRSGGRAPVMQELLRGKTDAELDALALWFSTQVSKAKLSPETVARGAEVTGRLVYIDEEAGWKRVPGAAHNRDYFLLSSLVESEKFLTFCSIASMAAVLNSFDIERPLDPRRYPYPYFTQENLFTAENQAVASYETVVTEGLVLADIARFLANLGVAPQVHFADQTDLETTRTLIRQGLDGPEMRVIVNYNRSALGQTGEGHVSPLGAYDEKTDSVLILDVARYKYPPAWVPLAMLHKAMESVDEGSGRSRGLILVAPF